MIELMAETITASNTMDANSIGIILTAVGGVIASAITATLAKKKGREEVIKETKTKIIDQPLETKHAPVYATQTDIDRIDNDIDNLRRMHREGEVSAHRRMDAISSKVDSIDGKMDVLLRICQGTNCTALTHRKQ